MKLTVVIGLGYPVRNSKHDRQFHAHTTFLESVKCQIYMSAGVRSRILSVLPEPEPKRALGAGGIQIFSRLRNTDMYITLKNAHIL